jgi:hypothetical protein
MIYRHEQCRVGKEPNLFCAENNLQSVSTYCGQSAVLTTIKAGGRKSDSYALIMQFGKW